LVNTVEQTSQEGPQAFNPSQQLHTPVPITYPTQNQIIANALQTLYQKLNEYTRVLSITNDLEISKQLCVVIRECSLAISALHNVHKTK